MKRTTLAWLLAIASCGLPALAATKAETAAAAAAARADALKQAEASMVVTGRISIDPSGRVTGYLIDRRSKVPTGVVAMIERYVPHWAFEPVQKDGSPVLATATMWLRIVARKTDDTHYQIGIRNAAFGDPAAEIERGSYLTKARMDPPSYPGIAYGAGASGTVYLRLKIDRSGHVADEIAEQVNLRTTGTPEQMQQWRDALAKSTLQAAAKWTFHPPTTGKEASRDYWDAVVPVIYRMDEGLAKYGEWEAYLPGAKQVVPWADPDDTGRSSDAFSDGSLHLAGSGLRLLTPLIGG